MNELQTEQRDRLVALMNEYIEALTKVRDYKLEFDMDDWVTDIYADEDDLGDEPCGTACCAAGWVATFRQTNSTNHHELQEYLGGYQGNVANEASNFTDEIRRLSSQLLCHPHDDEEDYYDFWDAFFSSGNPNDPNMLIGRAKKYIEQLEALS